MNSYLHLQLRTIRAVFLVFGLCALAPGLSHAQSDPSSAGPLIDFTKADDLKRCQPEDHGVIGDITDKGGVQMMKITADTGSADAYPGVMFASPEGGWNLKGNVGLSVDVVNPGDKPITVNLRADNAGDASGRPWDTENIEIAPYETKTLVLTFGVSYKAPGFTLDPSAIVAIHVFFQTPSQGASFLVGNLKGVR